VKVLGGGVDFGVGLLRWWGCECWFGDEVLRVFLGNLLGIVSFERCSGGMA
jgi:hypothetical protein